jgi:hypothetical protein
MVNAILPARSGGRSRRLPAAMLRRVLRSREAAVKGGIRPLAPERGEGWGEGMVQLGWISAPHPTSLRSATFSPCRGEGSAVSSAAFRPGVSEGGAERRRWGPHGEWGVEK